MGPGTVRIRLAAPTPYFLAALQSDSPDNPSGYASAAHDAALQRASLTRDPAARARGMEEAERILLQDTPVIPLYDFVQLRLVRPTVKGYRPNALGVSYSRYISIAAPPSGNAR
jgi:ABC-type oligopeptide transport system substrate-binding subunit